MDEKDYVHILEGMVLDKFPDAAFCICQVSEWERSYKQGAEKHALYESARSFDADVIVIRFIENCPGGDFDGEVFYNSLCELIDFVNADGEAKIIVTTGFWRHPGDAQLIKYAGNNSLPLVELGDLGEKDEMT